MRTLVLILLVGAAASFVERDEWAAYKEAHGKAYANPIEEFYRMKVYADNKAYVEKHNAEHAAGKHTFTVELNKFADLTTEEWSATYKGLKRGSTRPHGTHKIIGTAAATKDWRDDGAVTGVKNQGQCGSCWSFSATGALEGAWKLAGHDLPSLSEQQLVDCSGNYGNQGCNGGWQDQAFRYIRDYGIATERGYPYYAKQYQCQFTGGSDVTLSSWTDIAQYSEAALEDAASSVGPIAVSIDASRRSFQLYSSGIYYEPNCSQTQLDHAVLVVGYGDNYWTVKNSWGTGWGQGGYISMSKGSNNCGIASDASYPSV